MSDNNTIEEVFSLPSKGAIYGITFNPEVKLRSMTTNDEMKRLAPSTKQYRILCDIIDDCLITKLPISSYDMCLGDYQFLLYRLRAVTYGPTYKMRVKCPYCNSVENAEVNLDELLVNYYNENMLKYKEFELPNTKKKIVIKYQTPHLLDIISEAIEEDKKRTKKDRSLLITLMHLIETVDGNKVDLIKLESFVDTLPMMDTNFIIRCSEKLTQLIGIDTDVEAECEVCGLTFPTTFRTTTEFFGPEIDF